jgi:hypothetical protein
VALAVAPTALADPLADSDLANARLLVAVELLLADFYERALRTKQFGAQAGDALLRGQMNEQEHLAAVSGIVSGAGQTPAGRGDIDFSYPAGAFASRGAIARLGETLEHLSLAAYLGAVDSMRSAALKQPLARIAACEAQHLSVFRREATGHALAQSFPDVMTIDEASNALDAYTG